MKLQTQIPVTLLKVYTHSSKYGISILVQFDLLSEEPSLNMYIVIYEQERYLNNPMSYFPYNKKSGFFFQCFYWQNSIFFCMC